jgi:hypothetical protein
MKKIIAYPLNVKVLAVAVINLSDDGEVFDWAVYIKDVPGWCHEDEKIEVAAHGSKTNKVLAQAMFPNLDIEKYRL